MSLSLIVSSNKYYLNSSLIYSLRYAHYSQISFLYPKFKAVKKLISAWLYIGYLNKDFTLI